MMVFVVHLSNLRASVTRHIQNWNYLQQTHARNITSGMIEMLDKEWCGTCFKDKKPTGIRALR